MLKDIDADVAIIGAGPGGYVCGIRAAQLGMKTVVVEKHKLGGECLNYGCIPTKSMINASKLYSRIPNLTKFGISVQNRIIDIKKLMEWKNNVVSRLVNGIATLLNGYGAKIIYGEASIGKDRLVRVRGDDEFTINAKNIVIATGTKPAKLQGIEINGKNIITSKEAVQLETLPESILIVGGGVIGLEFACMFQNLGSKVTIVELMDQLLPGYDKDIARYIQRKLESRGAEIFLSSSIISAKDLNDNVQAIIKTKDGEISRQTKELLVSVGRVPSLEGIDVNSLGIKTDRKGYILTDDTMRTTAEGIYAIGDIRGPPLLAHKASKEGIVAAENIAGIESHADWKFVPDAIFTDPEAASVGLTEDKALEQGYKVKRARFNFAALGRAVSTDDAEGFVKVIFDEDTKVVLGIQIVGPEASNLISEAALAIEMGARLEDIALTIHPHPTFPEAIMEAAELGLDKPIHQLKT